MAKKIFTVFTLIMIIISGSIIYGIVSKAQKYQVDRLKKIGAKLPDENAGNLRKKTPTVTAAPDQMPEALYEDDAALRGKTITNGQKYYIPLSDSSDKNILLIGKDPTYSNFDTIIVVSINEENEKVRLIDLPRDIYIDYSEEILSSLKESARDFYMEKGSLKMNAAPVVGRKIRYSPEQKRFEGKSDMNFLCDLIYEIFSIDVDDYISVETDGFREMVDYFGGVVVDVPYPMHYEDPTQDLYIHIEPGVQLLNGTQAEGFVRFRQGYTPDGRLVYYSRADNTFLFLRNFFEQHVTLKNLGRVGKVYEIVRENSSTSVRSLGEAIQYAMLAKKIIENGYSIESVEIECRGSKTVNGSLYSLIRTE